MPRAPRSSRRPGRACAGPRRPSRRDDELRRALSPEQYRVVRENATERPFAHPYDHAFEPGIYVDVTSGEPLFASADKFDSGCGWPAFSRPLSKDVVTEHLDRSFGTLLHQRRRPALRAARAHGRRGLRLPQAPRGAAGGRPGAGHGLTPKSAADRHSLSGPPPTGSATPLDQTRPAPVREESASAVKPTLT